jgi:hypothetical protein
VRFTNTRRRVKPVKRPKDRNHVLVGGKMERSPHMIRNASPALKADPTTIQSTMRKKREEAFTWPPIQNSDRSVVERKPGGRNGRERPKTFLLIPHPGGIRSHQHRGGSVPVAFGNAVDSITILFLFLARLSPYQAAKASVWMKRSKRARGISTISVVSGDR